MGRRAKGVASRVSCPVSIRVMSRMSLISERSSTAEFFACLTQRRTFGGTSSATIASWSMPSSPLSGVRISWDMHARKASFASFTSCSRTVSTFARMIWLRARRHPDGDLTLVVIDTGVGIAKEEQQTVFERGFSGKGGRRADRGAERAAATRGMGLRGRSVLGRDVLLERDHWRVCLAIRDQQSIGLRHIVDPQKFQDHLHIRPLKNSFRKLVDLALR